MSYASYPRSEKINKRDIILVRSKISDCTISSAIKRNILSMLHTQKPRRVVFFFIYGTGISTFCEHVVNANLFYFIAC